MMHKTRVFGVAEIADPAELAAKLQGQTWTACTAFKSGPYYFANDSFSEDGAQEYAVLREVSPGVLAQIESITFGWCTPEKALHYVKETLAGKYDVEASRTLTYPADRFQSPHPTCHACA